MTSDLPPASSMASSNISPGNQEQIQDSKSTPGIPLVSSESFECPVEESVKSSIPGVKERYVNIVKRTNDSDEYRGLLLTNRMKVLLVSDSSLTTWSAAALQIQVGSYSDPDDLPGLAHFCEHMVFLGSEKYPEENVFKKYITEHGSTEYNGITTSDGTIFYFDIHFEHLKKALDIFAQFFISPLFTESATSRELNAVNSEHENNVASDRWRLYNLNKHISDPTHPFKKFNTGNKETLKTIPESKGIDVRQELLKFHENWYSSNIMSLVVIGKESLDELEAMVAPLFSTIKDKSVTAPSWPLNPIPLELRRKKIYGVPINDTRILTIDFAIPCPLKHYKSKPAEYLAQLIRNDGPGSLLSALKRRGWCKSIYSSATTPARSFAFFNVEVNITNEGIKHTDDIVSFIFQYLAVLKKEGPQQWLWEEQRYLMELDYHFNSTCNSINKVQEYAPLLQVYPMEDVLIIQNLITEWKPELITDLLSLLTPDNAVVTIFSKAFEDKCGMTDKWYETRYGFENIDESTLKKWTEVQPSKELHMPPPNEFIPSTLIVGKEGVPAILKDTQLMRIWYEMNQFIQTPEIKLRLVSPMIDAEHMNYYLCNLWVDLLVDRLQELTYGSAQAGMQWSVAVFKGEISITVKGYEEKLDLLLYKIIDQIVAFKADPIRFQVLRADFISSLENDINNTEPMELADDEEEACLSGWYLSASRPQAKEFLLKRKETQPDAILTPEQLDEFVASFIRKVHIESLIHGDISREKAIKIADSIEEKFPKDGVPLLAAQLLPIRSIELDKGTWYVRKINTKVHHESCASVYYACGMKEMRGDVILDLLSQLLQEPCFTTLRTKEQLGYCVNTVVVSYNGGNGLRITVQGERHPEHLDQRIEEFVQNFSEVLQNLSDEELLKAKSSLYIVNNLWNEIVSQEYNFDREQLEKKMLQEITKEDLVTFYKKYFSQDSPDRAKLSIHVISIAEGGAGAEDLKTTEDKQEEKVTQGDDKEKLLSEDSTGHVEEPVSAIITEEKNASEEDVKPSKQKHEENTTQNIDKQKSLIKDSPNSVEQSIGAVITVEKNASEEDKKKPLSENSPGITELTFSVNITVKVNTNREDFKLAQQNVKVTQKAGKALLEPEITTEAGATDENIKPVEKDQEIKITQKSDKIQLQMRSITDSTAKGVAVVSEEDFKPVEQEEKKNVTRKTDKIQLQPEIITDLLEFKSRRRLYPNPTPYIPIPRKGL